MTNSHRIAIAAFALAVAVLPGPTFAQGDAPKDIPGPIDSLQDLQDSGKMLFKLADANNDGMISQKEAVDAGNLLVGGVFFRADANGDGVLSQDEIKAAREDFMKEKPWLKYAIDTTKATRAKDGQKDGSNPDMAAAFWSAIDTNNDKQLQSSEVRQIVQSAVQGLFASADTNRDGQMSPTEVNAAVQGAAKTVAQAAFQQADADHNGSLSEAEFDQAVRKPTHIMFAVLDLNHDGQITQDELQKSRRAIIVGISKLRVPEPDNSPRKLIHSGQKPSDVAPVPTFNKDQNSRSTQTNPPATTTAPRNNAQP